MKKTSEETEQIYRLSEPESPSPLSQLPQSIKKEWKRNRNWIVIRRWLLGWLIGCVSTNAWEKFEQTRPIGGKHLEIDTWTLRFVLHAFFPYILLSHSQCMARTLIDWWCSVKSYGYSRTVLRKFTVNMENSCCNLEIREKLGNCYFLIIKSLFFFLVCIVCEGSIPQLIYWRFGVLQKL